MRLPPMMTWRLMIAVAAVGLAPMHILAVNPSSEVPYFPEGVFDSQDKENNDSSDERYTSHLRAMGEPSLWKLSRKKPAVTVYRLLWLPTFHRPVSVRIAKSGSEVFLHVKTLKGMGGYEPGKVAVKKSMKLNQERWDEFQRRLNKVKFWESPTTEEVVINPDFGIAVGQTDGDHLILEGVSEGKYHIVDRWEAEPEYESLCRYMLLELSGLQVRKVWDDYHD